MNRKIKGLIKEKSLDNIYQILKELHTSSEDFVLATIIHVEGTAYLKTGTTMLIRKDGTSLGVLSPGCLEEDIIQQSNQVFKGKRSHLLVYDLNYEEEPSLGYGVGCNGVLFILLERIDELFIKNVEKMKKEMKAGKVIILTKSMSYDFSLLTYEWASLRNEEIKGGLNWELLLDRENGLYSFTHIILPQPRIVVFGAGMDARPVVKLAASCGFSVIVCDWRETFCNKKYFPDADRLIIGFPNEIFQELELLPEDFVIIMSHNFYRDKEIIQLIRKHTVRYLGLLGSKQRSKALLKNDFRQQISAPIGFPIGAQGPEEIAVSIMAEIIARYRQKERA